MIRTLLKLAVLQLVALVLFSVRENVQCIFSMSSVIHFSFNHFLNIGWTNQEAHPVYIRKY